MMEIDSKLTEKFRLNFSNKLFPLVFQKKKSMLPPLVLVNAFCLWIKVTFLYTLKDNFVHGSLTRLKAL